METVDTMYTYETSYTRDGDTMEHLETSLLQEGDLSLPEHSHTAGGNDCLVAAPLNQDAPSDEENSTTMIMMSRVTTEVTTDGIESIPYDPPRPPRVNFGDDVDDHDGAIIGALITHDDIVKICSGDSSTVNNNDTSVRIHDGMLTSRSIIEISGGESRSNRTKQQESIAMGHRIGSEWTDGSVEVIGKKTQKKKKSFRLSSLLGSPLSSSASLKSPSFSSLRSFDSSDSNRQHQSQSKLQPPPEQQQQQQKNVYVFKTIKKEDEKILPEDKGRRHEELKLLLARNQSEGTRTTTSQDVDPTTKATAIFSADVVDRQSMTDGFIKSPSMSPSPSPSATTTRTANHNTKKEKQPSSSHKSPSSQLPSSSSKKKKRNTKFFFRSIRSLGKREKKILQ